MNKKIIGVIFGVVIIILGFFMLTNFNTADQKILEQTFVISAVYFEAQLQSASGKVYARLYDKNTGPFLDSEVSHSAGDAKLISAGVNISGGGRTIGVQLKSEIQQPVKVLSSRLRIDTK